MAIPSSFVEMDPLPSLSNNWNASRISGHTIEEEYEEEDEKEECPIFDPKTSTYSN